MLKGPYGSVWTEEMATDTTVPTYASDGRRLRRYTLEAIERLERLNLVAVQRNRHGRIVIAHFRPTDGANPIRTTAHMGTKYSFNEHLPSGHMAWKYRRLIRDERALAAMFGESPDDVEDAELFVRAVFRAVPLSCMAKPAKVVSIDTSRKQKATARPIEFDSERRVA